MREADGSVALTILDYDHERDWEALKRIYFEVGWLDDEDDAKAFEPLAKRYDGVVFPLDGAAECAVFMAPGAMRHLENDVDMAVVAGVTTSRVARKLGAAQRLTAHSVARYAGAGAEIAALGMFDQGFYDRLGFGTGSYQNRIQFDPATLTVEDAFRPPKRIGRDQWQDVYTAMQNRLRGHGACLLNLPEIPRYDLASVGDKTVGLGYYDGPGGTLSHFFWGETKGEHGPYNVYYYAYQTPAQLFELLALMKSLGDQVSSFVMDEPPEIQFQDLLRQPFRHRTNTEGSKYAARHETLAYWQARMLDVAGCLAKTHLDAEPVTFNLALRDPIAEHLDGTNAWNGCAGDYVVTLGEESAAETGRSPNLPTLNASIGAFTRLWLGVRNASSLTLTDDVAGDEALLRALDRSLRLPRPHLGWDF